MLFLEKLGRAKSRFSLSVFGTDIDNRAFDEAKEVTYSRDRLAAVNKELLEKYFEKTKEGQFKLKFSVTNLVRFRNHEIVKENPLFHCDIILCRNLLIYFNRQLQEETLLKFYEGLNPGGFLVLGMVESLVGSAANIFETVDNRFRIYRKPINPQLRYNKDETGMPAFGVHQ